MKAMQAVSFVMVVSILAGTGLNCGKFDEIHEVTAPDASCAPTCGSKQCGPDGCGGYCGSCASGSSCSGEGVCKVLPTCNILHEIACGGWVEGSTVAAEAFNRAYSCQGYQGEAPELGYAFVASVDDHVTFSLLSSNADLDLVVTDSPCAPDSCVVWGDEHVELEVSAGQKYYVMVEGQDDNVGEFLLISTCHSICEPECDGKECGGDGCGGICGVCPEIAPYCASHKCAMECVPVCTGKDCGDDECGGSCGNCSAGNVCGQGQCVDSGAPDGCQARSLPGCDGCECEACVCDLDPVCCAAKWDEVCGAICQSTECPGCDGEGQFGWPCKSDTDCLAGPCVVDPVHSSDVCTAPCVESCPPEWYCLQDEMSLLGSYCSGHCVFSCGTHECGDDGCGSSCGQCPYGDVCAEGTCNTPAGDPTGLTGSTWVFAHLSGQGLDSLTTMQWNADIDDHSLVLLLQVLAHDPVSGAASLIMGPGKATIAKENGIAVVKEYAFAVESVPSDARITASKDSGNIADGALLELVVPTTLELLSSKYSAALTILVQSGTFVLHPGWGQLEGVLSGYVPTEATYDFCFPIDPIGGLVNLHSHLSQFGTCPKSIPIIGGPVEGYSFHTSFSADSTEHMSPALQPISPSADCTYDDEPCY